MLVLLLSVPSIQTYLGGRVTNYLNEEFKTNINVGGVGLRFNGDVELKDVNIIDYKGAPLFTVNELDTSILSVNKLINGKLTFGDITLDGLVFNLVIYKGERDSNLDVFVARFDEDNPDARDSSFLLSSSDVTISNSRFIYTDYNLERPKFLDFKNLFINGTSFLIQGPNVSTRINQLRFKDDRGMEVSQMATNFSYTKKAMLFKDLILNTTKSKLKGNVAFNYNRKDFADFENKVKLKANLVNSKIDFDDLNVFYSEFNPRVNADFNGNISGTLNNLILKNSSLKTNRGTKIKGDFVFENLLVKKENTFKMIGDINEFDGRMNHLRSIMPKVIGGYIPENFNELGVFSIKGKTEVTAQNILANLDIDSNLGVAKTDLIITDYNNDDLADYKGNLILDEFDLGPLFKDEKLSAVSLNLDIDGNGFKSSYLNANLKGDVYSINYNNYNYKNIVVNGDYKEKNFKGYIKADDPNFDLIFNGLADFSGKKNVFNFESDINYINLNALNFSTKDKISELKGKVIMDMKANSLDDAVGSLSFYNGEYKNEVDTYKFTDFNIESRFINQERIISVNSPDIIEGQLKGVFRFNDLPKLFENSIMSLYTNYKPKQLNNNQYLNFDFTVYNKIVVIFFPEAKLEGNTTIKGKVENDEKKFKLSFKSPKVKWLESFAENIELQVDNSNPLFNTYIELDSLKTDVYNLSKFSLINVTVNDTLFIRSDFKGGNKNKDNFDLSLFYTINEANQSILGVKPSKIKYKGTDWTLNKENNKAHKITFDRSLKNFDIKSFLIENGNSYVKVDGNIIGKSKALNLDFKDVELAEVIQEIDSVSFSGKLNGKIKWFQNAAVNIPKGNISIDSLAINGVNLGDIDSYVKGNNSLTNYTVKSTIRGIDETKFKAEGIVDVSTENSKIDLNLDFNNFSLKAINPFLVGVLEDIRGELTGKATVTGKATKPMFYGDLTLNNGGMNIPYLNVDYQFKDNSSVSLRNQSFLFNNINFVDKEKGTKAVFDGSVSHTNFGNWRMDLDIFTTKLLILNTKYNEDALYYGTGFIGGKANISGQAEALKIEVNAQTKPGTVFKIPLNDNESFGDNSFVHFISKDEKIAKQTGKRVALTKTDGLELKFDLDVTEDAEIEIVIDKSSGSTIKGKGRGNLLFDINTNDKFNMYGDFIIYQGVYNFLYRGVVEKHFTVKPLVSTLEWNGDPYKALINIRAVYKTRANPSPLLDNPINRAIPVELGLNLTDQLEKPTLDYNFVFPNVDSTLKSELQYRLESKEDRANQALFLLATGDFNSSFSNVNISGTITERLNGLINGLFSGNDNKLNIGVNYQAGKKRPDYQTDERLGVTLQTQISERVLINGKVGVPIGEAGESVIAGDVQVDFILNDQGTLTAKVFNRQNSIRNFGEEIGYTQGLGLAYSVDFDTFGELLRKIFMNKENRAKKELADKEKDDAEKLPEGLNFVKEKPNKN